MTSDIYSFHGIQPWKTVVLMAWVHGNEPSGIRSLQLLLKQLHTIDAGTLHIIFANPEAIVANKRYIDKNMNRYFFDNTVAGCYETKRIQELIPYLAHADILLDIHNTERKNSEAFLLSNHPEFYSLFPVTTIVQNIDSIEPWWSDGYVDSKGGKGICFEAWSLYDGIPPEQLLAMLYNFLRYTGTLTWTAQHYTAPSHHIQAKRTYIAKTKFCKLSQAYADFSKVYVWEILWYDGTETIIAPEDGYIFFAHQQGKIWTEMFCFGV